MRNKSRIITVALYISFCFILLFALSRKENYDVDEIYSYGLANHQGDGTASMKVKKGKIYKNSEKPYLNYITVNKKHTFDYKNVWENQKIDVHPPLYYAILHTICSFFPGRFSLWFAGSINIIFAMLTLFMVRKMILYLTADDKVCFLLSVGFILCSGIISSVTFLRMYNMAMFWVVTLAYLFLTMLHGEISKKKLALLYLTTVLSALTHYYCIVYVVLISVVFGFYLLANKKWKALIAFCVTMLVAAGTAILIFPSMIEHMFFGYRGEEAIVNLQNSEDYWIRIKNFFNCVSIELFGNVLGYLLLILLFAGLYTCYQKANSSKERAANDNKWILQYVFLFIPIVAYFLLISKMAAFQIDRYMFPIYAVAFVALLCCMNQIMALSFTEKQRIALLCVLLAVMTYGSWKNIGWPYLYQQADETIEALEDYADVDCVFIYAERFRLQYKYREVSGYDTVTFLKDNDLSKLPDYEQECTELIVIINSPNLHEDYLNTIMAKYPSLTQYRSIVGVGEGTTYYLCGDGE